MEHIRQELKISAAKFEKHLQKQTMEKHRGGFYEEYEDLTPLVEEYEEHVSEMDGKDLCEIKRLNASVTALNKSSYIFALSLKKMQCQMSDLKKELSEALKKQNGGEKENCITQLGPRTQSRPERGLNWQTHTVQKRDATTQCTKKGEKQSHRQSGPAESKSSIDAKSQAQELSTPSETENSTTNLLLPLWIFFGIHLCTMLRITMVCNRVAVMNRGGTTATQNNNENRKNLNWISNPKPTVNHNEEAKRITQPAPRLKPKKRSLLRKWVTGILYIITMLMIWVQSAPKDLQKEACLRARIKKF